MIEAQRRYVLLIMEVCRRLGVTLILGGGEKVVAPDESENLASAGFFDDDEQILAVATGVESRFWFPTLIHEYCHMLQWDEKVNFGPMKGDFWKWLDGKDILFKDARKDSLEHLRCEIDCEMRVVDLLKANPQLNIEPVNYTKQANAYLFSYLIMLEQKKWYSTSPCMVQDLVDGMPDYFLTLKEYLNPNDWYRNLAVEKCF